MLGARDYYLVLGVERCSDAEVVKKAKRAMALTTHPDKNPGVPGANEAFRRVNEVRMYVHGINHHAGAEEAAFALHGAAGCIKFS